MKPYFALAMSSLLSLQMIGQVPLKQETGADYTIRVDSALVQVPAMVLSASGHPLRGLTSSDFRLTDDAVEQMCRMEDSSPVPPSIVLLMQTGGDAYLQFRSYRRLQPLFTSLIGGFSHRLALITFDSRPEEIWNFPAGTEGIQYAFVDPRPGDKAAAIMDAVVAGLDLLDQQPPTPRRIIILLSQSRDEGSKILPAELLKRLGESNTAVFSITFQMNRGRRNTRSEKARLSESSIREDAAGADALIDRLSRKLSENTAAAIAQLSGGESVSFSDSSELQEKLMTLAAQIPSTYTLDFKPDSTRRGLHLIQVSLKKNVGVVLATRGSYWNPGSTEVTDPQGAKQSLQPSVIH
jgi:VWFA-related protein